MTQKDIEKADGLLRRIEPNMVRAFENVGGYLHISALERILGQIQANGGLPQAEIYSRNRAEGPVAIREILDSLETMKKVRSEPKDGDRWYYPTKA